MRVPLEWLREYIDYGRLSPSQVAEYFESSGVEVERVLEGSFDPGIVVAEIMTIRPHPGADRLRLVRVRAGRRRLEVVCGAANIEIGQRVALAYPGVMVEGRTLEAVEIRGVKSEGMLLSARELGISDEHSGIWVLDPGLQTGVELGRALGAVGATLELAASAPNRPDRLGVWGLARELWAVLQARGREAELRLPSFRVPEGKVKLRGHLRVSIENRRDTPQYLARMVEFDPSQETPVWMRRRLESAGMRPRSLAVDVTNYVMLETAQPLHAFDADVLGGELSVRRARAGEGMRALDGEHYDLDP